MENLIMKVLYNVYIYTMDDNYNTATAIAWEGETIKAVGSREEILKNYPHAEHIDGKGKTVLPGFIDAHNHFIWGIMFNGILSCTPDIAPTVDALKKLLHNESKKRAGGEWIVAQGYDPWEFQGCRIPTRHDLDEACPDNPALIVHYSMHECIANTRALDAAGIDRKTRQPIGGKIVKDMRKNPTGHLIELAITQVEKLARQNLIRQTGSDLIEMINKAQNHLLSLGITRICDAAVSPEIEDIYQKSYENGAIKMPVIMNPSSESGLYELPWDSIHHAPTGEGSRSLKVGPLKIYMDGANQCGMKMNLLQIFLAAVVAGYQTVKSLSLDSFRALLRSELQFGRDLKIHTGLFTSTVANYQEIAAQAVNNDFALCIHAIGNEAVENAIDVIKTVRNKHQAKMPPRIDHALFMDNESIKRISDLGIAVVTQPYFLTHMHSGNVPYLNDLKKMPLKSFINMGVRVAGSSDWPVASINPLLAMERAVTRMTKGGERLQEDESLNINEALALYTREAAYALGCDDEAGSLETGKRADFIILSENPGGLREGEWKNVKIIKTYLAGDLVYSS
jgi:hypothetical protein